MGYSTHPNSRWTPEDDARRRGRTFGDTPGFRIFSYPAGNDATCGELNRSEDAADPLIPALGGGRFPVEAAGTAPAAPPTSHALHRVARAHRSFILGGMMIRVMRAVGASVRRAFARHCQRRDARATYDALRRLDDRTLHDLGFDRSELTSVAAEVSGQAQCARLRILVRD